MATWARRLDGPSFGSSGRTLLDSVDHRLDCVLHHFFFFLRRVRLVNDKQSVTGDCSFARSLTFYAVPRYLIRDL